MKNETKMLALLEALLFAGGDPLDLQYIADILEIPVDAARLLLEQLQRRYQRDVWSGLCLIRTGDKFAIATKPQFLEVLSKMYTPENSRQMSGAAYETLAVIAYSEPVTRAEIEEVRGVNSDSIVTRLIERGYVEQRGELDVVGHPALLYVTDKFLAAFGLKSTKELPAVDLLPYDSNEQERRRNLLQQSQEPAAPLPIILDNNALADDVTTMDTIVADQKDHKLIIALDGPSGAGKSTLAKALAKKLDIIALDTGAMYRALGRKAVLRGLDYHDAEAMQQMLTQTTMNIKIMDGEQHTFVDGDDYTDFIRTPEISMAASGISAHKEVRDYAVALQRQLANKISMVIDGRDIGTYVLPHIKHKFFVTAPLEVRAERRFRELRERGDNCLYSEVLLDMEKRDNQDKNRKTAPLTAAADAIIIDSDNKTVAELCDEICRHLKEKK